MPAIAKYGIRTDEDKYFKVAQPVWVEQNAYSGAARAFREEKEPIFAQNMDVSIRAQGDEWIVTLNVPEEVSSADCRLVNTERLGTPRISECRYEQPDGTPIELTSDIMGNCRGEQIIPGPFARLSSGTNEISVWKE